VGVHTTSILPILSLSWEHLQNQVSQMISTAGFQGAVLWLSYIALEPIVRRRWPKMLVSWSRLLQGGVLDPLVGRDVLIGATSAGLTMIVFKLMPLTEQLIGAGTPPPGIAPAPFSLHSTLSSALWVLHLPLHALEGAMTALLIFVFLTILLRKTSFAIAALILFAMAAPLIGGAPWTASILSGIGATLTVAILIRFGFLSVAIGFALAGLCSAQIYSTNFTTWYGTGTLVTLLAFAVVAGYGFWVSLAGHPMFGNIE